MAMFEVEGQSKVDATDCTTTGETLVKVTNPVGIPRIQAKNCHAGVSSATQDKPTEPSLPKLALKWSAEAAIKWAVPLLLGALLTTVSVFWPTIKNFAVKVAALIL